ncbi:unnamed protein product, partial [Brassica oleracea var. botrytis]
LLFCRVSPPRATQRSPRHLHHRRSFSRHGFVSVTSTENERRRRLEENCTHWWFKSSWKINVSLIPSITPSSEPSAWFDTWPTKVEKLEQHLTLPR